MVGLELVIASGEELHLSSPGNSQSPRPTHREMHASAKELLLMFVTADVM